MKLPAEIRKAFAAAGAEGGHKAAERMSKAEKTERAKKAAKARWKGKGKRK